MHQAWLDCPVLFIVFNRPDTTKRVFERIGKVKPKQLFVAADGARANRAEDADRCRQVREIVQAVDWDCELKTLFRVENVGCKLGVTSAINWFFEYVPEGIILEDDTLPDKSFFWYCQELLQHYRDDTRVMHIGGTNPITQLTRANSYHFSKYNRIWGWATWKRAWRYYSNEIKFWPEIKSTGRYKYLFDRDEEAELWMSRWDLVSRNKMDTWDYQWFLCRLTQGLAIVPDVNLVSNLGFGPDATHTLDPNSELADRPTGEMYFPLRHPEHMIIDKGIDRLFFEHFVLPKIKPQSPTDTRQQEEDNEKPE